VAIIDSSIAVLCAKLVCRTLRGGLGGVESDLPADRSACTVRDLAFVLGVLFCTVHAVQFLDFKHLRCTTRQKRQAWIATSVKT
jgi:hypothetical protein